MDRREFLKSTGLFSMWFPVFGSSCSDVPRQRTNILFCISDDQSVEHVGINGCSFVNTPGFDRVAQEGILFKNAFISAPSCCPSRASVLTGLPFYRLNETSMNHTPWSAQLVPYTDLLAKAGYHVGFTGKGCGPTDWAVSGLSYNPAGRDYNDKKNETPSSEINPIDYAQNFEQFLEDCPEGVPFCFWYGGIDPHRVFEYGSGVANGKKLEEIEVPPYFPDCAEVRNDIADYALHIDWFDRHLSAMLDLLESRGQLADTLVVVTSDNGMAFPRCKATPYDSGTHMPLAVRWGNQIKPGRVVEDFVSFVDFAPTFLEIAGQEIPAWMEGESLVRVLRAQDSGQVDPGRDSVVFGVERHLPGGRENGEAYPIRAIRTGEYLYVINYAPDRWPAGDPAGPVWPSDDPTGGFGDVDGSPTKTKIWELRETEPEYYERSFGKRPAEELYNVREDPHQLTNLAQASDYAEIKERLRERLTERLKQTRDPRSIGDGERLDNYARKFTTTLG